MCINKLKRCHLYTSACILPRTSWSSTSTKCPNASLAVEIGLVTSGRWEHEVGRVALPQFFVKYCKTGIEEFPVTTKTILWLYIIINRLFQPVTLNKISVTIMDEIFRMKLQICFFGNIRHSPFGHFIANCYDEKVVVHCHC